MRHQDLQDVSPQGLFNRIRDPIMNSKTGTLFLVATPIGNLNDISQRAIQTLKQAELILVEDTRHAAILLTHHAVSTKTRSFHEHNEERQVARIVEQLHEGKDIAVISDAGTPLICDPGYRLVREAVHRGVGVVPIPGPCAATAALSASGLATDRFCFEGFLPAKQAAREQRLAGLKSERRTLIFYESSHRIVDCLDAIRRCLGPDREVCVGREISKKFETFYYGSLDHVAGRLQENTISRKGEFVIVLGGSAEDPVKTDEAKRLLSLLIEELPLRTACEIAAKYFHGRRNDLYRIGLEIQKNKA